MRTLSQVLVGMMVLSIFISCSEEGSISVQQDNESEFGDINRYYITRSSYTIDPGYLDEKVELGDGIDMSNPLSPEVAPHTALKKEGLLRGKEGGLAKSSDVIKEKTSLTESLSERQEANILSTYFKASYMLSSVEGAYKNAREERESYHTIYALLEHSGESDVLQKELRYWRPDEVPVSESIADPDEALLQFLETYGSHYVSGIRYGLRIAVQGKIRKDSKVSATDFSGKFKAAFGSFSAEAGARNQHKKALESMGTELLLEVTSGGREKGPSLLSLRSFDDISKFLDDLKNDKIQFRVAPIELTLHHYWPILNLEWKMRALLNPLKASFTPPIAPFGVPKGTIIAWHPTPDYVKIPNEDSLQATIVAPPGWAICDGTRGTPDLRGRFICGTAVWTPTVVTGGTKTHDHGGGGTTKNNPSRESNWGGGAAHRAPTYHKHNFTITSNTHMPPYAELVYIMKLEDLP